MAFTVADGILGLEGIWNVASTLDINVQGALPRVKLDRVVGLHGLPEIDDHREANYAQAGEQVYITNNRGKTIGFEGRVQGRTLGELRNLSVLLRLAFSHTRQTEGDFTCRPNAAVGGPTWKLRGRTLSFELDDEQLLARTAVPTPWQRSFIASVRMGDPRYFLVGQDVVVSGSSGQTRSVNNTGNANAEPVFVVSGPLSNATLDFRKLSGTPRLLRYEKVTLSSGQQLRLDFQARTFKRVSDSEDFDYLRQFSHSNWWDGSAAALLPGLNDVQVTGAAWTMSFAPAGW